jgi:hypothetical protein
MLLPDGLEAMDLAVTPTDCCNKLTRLLMVVEGSGLTEVRRIMPHKSDTGQSGPACRHPCRTRVAAADRRESSLH